MTLSCDGNNIKKKKKAKKKKAGYFVTELDILGRLIKNLKARTIFS